MAEQVFQVGIKALITNQANEVLMVKTVFADGGMQWDIPGGRMDPGETFLKTLERELAEEIGVDGYASCTQLSTVLSNKRIKLEGGETGLILVVYTVVLKPEALPAPAEQGSELRWLTRPEAAELLRGKYPADFCEKITK